MIINEYLTHFFLSSSKQTPPWQEAGSYWTTERSILKIESNRAAWLAVLSGTRDRREIGATGEELRCAEQQVRGSNPGRGKDGMNNTSR